MFLERRSDVLRLYLLLYILYKVIVDIEHVFTGVDSCCKVCSSAKRKLFNKIGSDPFMKCNIFFLSKAQKLNNLKMVNYVFMYLNCIMI